MAANLYSTLSYRGSSGYADLTSEEPENDPYESVSRLRTRYESAGETPPEPEKSTGLAEKFIKAIDYGDNIVRGGILEGWEGVKTAAKADKTYSTRQWLDEKGMEDGGGKTALAFLGDVLLSPTTYMGGGLIKGAGKKGLETATARKAGEKLTGRAATKTAEQLKKPKEQGVYDLERILGTDPNQNPVDVTKGLTGDTSKYGLEQYASRANTQRSAAEAGVNTNQAKLDDTWYKVAGRRLDPKVKTDLSAKLGDVDSGILQPNAFRSTKSRTEVNSRFESLFGKKLTHDQKRSISNLSKTNPRQLDVTMNLAESYGTQILDVDTAIRMAGKFQDNDLVQDIVATNDRLIGAKTKLEESTVRATFANNLVVDIDEIGNHRYYGVVSPVRGKVILPLADITPIYDKANKLGGLMYEKVPGYKRMSDWWRKAITGKPTREVMKDPDKLADWTKGAETVKTYGRQRRIVPKIIDDFSRNTFGSDVMEGDTRTRMAVYAYKELGVPRSLADGAEIRDPYTVYLWSQLAENHGISDEELAGAMSFISKDGSVERWMEYVQNKLVTPVLGGKGKLTDDEVRVIQDLAGKTQVSTDFMYELEKIRGLYDGKGYNSNYVHHMYNYTNPALKQAWKETSPDHSGKTATSTNASFVNPREFRSIAEAIAKDARIVAPMLDIVELTSARLAESIKLGMNRGLVEGIDKLALDADMQIAYAKVAEKHGIRYTERAIDVDPTGKRYPNPDLPPEERAKAEGNAVYAKGTMNALKQALGGMDGLKELAEVIRPSSAIHHMDMHNWQPILNVDELTPSRKGSVQYYVHNSLKPYIDLISKPMSSVDAWESFLQRSDTATRYLKKLQTTYNPSFLPRNTLGESVMSIYGNGTDPTSFADAYRVLAARTTKTKTKLNGKDMYRGEATNHLNVLRSTDTVNLDGVDMPVEQARLELDKGGAVGINGRSYTAKELYDKSMHYGLITAGHVTEHTADAMRVGTSNSGVKGAAQKASKAVEGAVDDVDAYFRMADFIHNLRQGMSESEAAMRVKMFHVDYQDLTQTEKAIFKRIVPYYTFMRKNIPIQLRMMVERPGYYSTLGILLNDSYEAMGDPATPEYLQKNLALPVYEDEDGNVTYLSWNLPLTDLNKFRIGDPQETMKELYQTLHPGMRAFTDLTAGENIAFGSPIQGVDYFGNQLGGASTAYKSAQDMLTPEETGKYAKPDQYPAVRSLLPQVNPEREELARAYRYREELLVDSKERKDAGQPLPEMNTSRPYSDIVRLPSYDSRGAYERDPNYWKNKNWVQQNNDRFTP